MKKFLNESDKKNIISEKEKMIIESFAKTFNKIKRIDENEINGNIHTLANILQNKGSLDHLKNNDRIRLKLIDGEFLKKNPEWKDKSLKFLFYDTRSHMVGVELIGTGKSGNAYPKELVIDSEQTNINEFEELNPLYSRQQEYGINSEIEPEEFNQEDELTGIPKNKAGGDSPYYETLSQTLDAVRDYATKLGYELDEDVIFSKFGTGGISYETYKAANIPLLKNGEPILNKSGKEMNRAIHVSIYRMPSGKYELTMYKTY